MTQIYRDEWLRSFGQLVAEVGAEGMPPDDAAEADENFRLCEAEIRAETAADMRREIAAGMPIDIAEHDDAEDDDELGPSAKAAAEKLPGLYASHFGAFVEIAELLADQQGIGRLDELSPERLRSLVREGVELAEGYDDIDAALGERPEPHTPLEILLQRHWDIEQELLNVRDEASGLV